jgi:hypothetical protein
MPQVAGRAVRDVDIRRCLDAHVHRVHEREEDVLILHELGLSQGTARVDLAVVNGTIHGYEIKSQADSLDRLPAQLSVYGRALDYATLVVSPNHLARAKRMVPRWWGIWLAAASPLGLALTEIRSASQNPRQDKRALVELLWRDEALRELEGRGLAKGLRSKPRSFLWDRLAMALSIDELRIVVRDCLKLRGVSWRPAYVPLASSDGWFRPSAR